MVLSMKAMPVLSSGGRLRDAGHRSPDASVAALQKGQPADAAAPLARGLTAALDEALEVVEVLAHLALHHAHRLAGPLEPVLGLVGEPQRHPGGVGAERPRP
jgi:hypothetical protein